MTAMPQMVAVLNGLGGGASALVAADEYLRIAAGAATATADVVLTIIIGVLVGAVTFSGSVIACGKLHEGITGRAVTYPLQEAVTAVGCAGIVAPGGWLVVAAEPSPSLFLACSFASLLLGVLLVVPIGGADMPVVIAFLNS